MTGEVIARCVLYTIMCFGYAAIGSGFLKWGIEGFKRGEYFRAGCSFLLVVPNIALLVKMAWEL